MRAMPSPTCRTVPISARSVSTSYCSIRCFRIDVISSGRSFTVLPFPARATPGGTSRLPQTPSTGPLRGRAVSPRPHQVVSQSLQSAADGCVHLHRARAEHDAADQARVDGARRLDAAPGRFLDLAHDRRGLVVRELLRGRQLDAQAPLLPREQALELAADVLDLADPPLLGGEAEEVPHELVRPLSRRPAEEVLEDAHLRARLELRVPQHGAQLRHLADGRDEIVQLLCDLGKPTFLLRSLEERL